MKTFFLIILFSSLMIFTVNFAFADHTSGPLGLEVSIRCGTTVYGTEIWECAVNDDTYLSIQVIPDRAYTPVMIRIEGPSENLIYQQQVLPADTWSTHINPSNNFSIYYELDRMWKQDGVYSIIAWQESEYEKRVAVKVEIINGMTPSREYTLYSSSVVNPTTSSTTILTLQEPSDPLYRYNSAPTISVPINGYLISHGQPVVGATINFIVNDTPSPKLSTKTDSNGFFRTYFKSAALDSSYRLQATFDGTIAAPPDKSLTKSFTVSKTASPPSSTLSPQSSPQSEDSNILIVGIIIALMIAGIIAVVIKNRNKLSVLRKFSQLNLQNKFSKIVKINQYMQNIRIFKRQSQSAPPTGQTVPFHFACPDCSAKLQPPTSPNAGQKCQSCGWKS